MNWKSIGTTLRVYAGSVNFDHVDANRGFFCGTHNYVKFYAVNVEDNYGGFFNCGKFFGTLSGEYTHFQVWKHDDSPFYPPFETLLLPVFLIRGEVVSSGVSSEMFGRIRELLEHRCGCQDQVKTPTGGHADGEHLAQRMNKTFGGVLSRTKVACPEGCEGFYVVWEMVIHLNDGHRWSREKIADWLESSGNNPSFPMPEEEK